MPTKSHRRHKGHLSNRTEDEIKHINNKLDEIAKKLKESEPKKEVFDEGKLTEDNSNLSESYERRI